MRAIHLAAPGAGDLAYLPVFPALMGTISGGLDRLPMPQPLCDQLRALPIVASVEDVHVPWIGTPEDTGRPRARSRVCVRTSRKVSGRALGRLHPDLPRPVHLRRVRIQRP